MDFGKHLDYMPMALHAGKSVQHAYKKLQFINIINFDISGKMALSAKHASGPHDSGQRKAKAYIPTFYTSRQNLAAQQASR